MKYKIIALLLSALFVFAGCNPKKYNGSSSEQSSYSEPSSDEASSQSSETEPSTPDELDIPSSDEEEPESPVIAPLEPSAIELTESDIGDCSPYSTELLEWGHGLQVDQDNRPLSGDLYTEKYGEYGGVFIMPADEQKIYLTFDEGYENGYTPLILDTLKEKNCPAVFFVTLHYVKAQPELIQRMIDEGHIVGNHSATHKVMPKLTVQEQIDEIAELHNYMVENYNYQMSLFRPPEGKYSEQSLYVAQQLGYKSVLWSFAYADWDATKQMGIEKAFPKVTNASHNGAVYLLHAVSKDNAEMLGDVIDYWRENDYSIEPLVF